MGIGSLENIKSGRQKAPAPVELIESGEPETQIVETPDLIPMTLYDLADKIRGLNRAVEIQSNDIKNILTRLTEWDDQGDYIFKSDTASTTVIDYDYIQDINHPVKGFLIINDSDVNDNITIKIGYNSSETLLDVSEERFALIYATEDHSVMYRKQRIRRIMIKTDSGTAAFRLWVFW